MSASANIGKVDGRAARGGTYWAGRGGPCGAGARRLRRVGRHGHSPWPSRHKNTGSPPSPFKNTAGETENGSGAAVLARKPRKGRERPRRNFDHDQRRFGAKWAKIAGRGGFARRSTARGRFCLSRGQGGGGAAVEVLPEAQDGVGLLRGPPCSRSFPIHPPQRRIAAIPKRQRDRAPRRLAGRDRREQRPA